MRPHIDVAVVGAGPAGALAACRLARGGARVTIFDPSHPREKPCGGGITGRALALVRDLIDISAYDATPIRFARFTSALDSTAATHGETDPVVTLPEGSLVVASRRSIDAALLGAAIAAGTRLEKARVRDVSVGRSGATIVTTHGTHSADIVIGADGATGIVRRRLAAPFTRSQLSIATGFFAHGATSDEIVLEMVADPPGYLWSFPRADHLAIGICAQAGEPTSAGALRDATRVWLARTMLTAGACLQAYSWPIPSLTAGDLDRARFAGPWWALAGDAAGLVDPITREGIFFALASGGWVADALLTDRGLTAYAERVRAEAVPELVRAARLKTLFFRPPFVRLLLEALRQSGAVRAVMADLIAGAQPYATLKWRLLATLEFGLAWRALRAATN